MFSEGTLYLSRKVKVIRNISANSLLNKTRVQIPIVLPEQE